MKLLTLTELIAAQIEIPAIAYGRVSSEKQLHGEGLRRQREGSYRWISKHPEMRIRLDVEKEDAARSAWKGNHVSDEDSALGSILEMVKSGALGPPLLLIVEHLDRLSRENPWRAHEQLAGMVRRGILVATTRDDKIYHLGSNIGDIIMSVVYAAAAYDESVKKSERVSETKQRRVLEAMMSKHVLHQNAPGWLWVREAISPTNRATRRYELILQHCETVLTIYQLGLHHGAGYICAWLVANEKPAMGRTGKWNIRHVRRILHSRAVLGHLESRHGLIENIFPPVPGLTEELWLRVQAAQKQRRDELVGGYRLGTHNNLFAGIGICTTCNGKMRINTRGGRRYYECQNHVVLDICQNRSRYRVDRIEDALFEALDFLEISPGAAPPASNLSNLIEEHVSLLKREKFLEGKLQEVANDEDYDAVMRQLRELRRKVKDAATTLTVAKQQNAVTTAPVMLSRDADRAQIAAGLKARMHKALFFPDRSVQLISKAGLLLVIPPSDSPALMFKSPNGQAAVLLDGKVHIATEGLPAVMPPLDARTIGEVQARLKQRGTAISAPA